ncbi:MAG TPA: S46 family peptidase, partial [Flavobacteriales bacterium]|nr:S46 family peptidase [Flavobacteriales bacterium]
WAATLADELPNPGLSATFIVRMEDVTDRVLAGVKPGMTESERTAAIDLATAEVAVEAKSEDGYSAVVKPFNYGNNWYLIVSETYRDIRLVGAPPGSIGNFGGDTDNWMWPRHTGDFSVFRIYAGKDNRPAAYAADNVPFKPRRSLTISLDGVKEGDFAMIFGFPGSTQRYLASPAVAQVMNFSDPLRIRMRRASLDVIDAAMLASDKTRLQYANKQKGISNAWKKWIGEVRGLKELDAVEEKRAFEAEFRKRDAQNGTARYTAALDSIDALYKVLPPYITARDLISELLGTGPEILRFANGFSTLVNDYDTLIAKDALQAELERLRKAAEGFYKEYDPAVDRDIFEAQFRIYRSSMSPGLSAPEVVALGDEQRTPTGPYVDDLYERSIFDDQARMTSLLKNFTKKARKRLAADPAFTLVQALLSTHATKVQPALADLNERLAVDMRRYMEGQIALFPERTFWPDANSTLRLSYGKVEGSIPRDGVEYTAFTTLDGAVAKYVPGDAEFDLPPRLLELHRNKDYGRYGTDTGMPVCFTSSLHTTGGNSGSPVLNGRGELIGINFDRTWESTMSDIRFDPDKCRNISVDIRYVLFTIDKLCGAQRLVDEMKLVRHVNAPMPMHLIPLPIHR